MQNPDRSENQRDALFIDARLLLSFVVATIVGLIFLVLSILDWRRPKK